MTRQLQSAAEVIAHLESNQRVFVHGGAATPNVLLQAMVDDAARLRNVELIHLHTEGPALYADQKYASHFSVTNLFVGPNMRPHLDNDRIDYLPCSLFEMPKLLRRTSRRPDVALLHLSEPDENGYCTLGTSVDVARTACDIAKLRLAQINKRMPRVHGDSYIHIDEVDHFVEVDEPLPEPAHHTATFEEIQIGKFAAGLIGNGACLQVGIGAIPDAVLNALAHHKHLGIHSEMWSDGALGLIKSGVVDNSCKTLHRGKTVSSFVLGSRELYDFINDNASVLQLPADFVNCPPVIAQNANVVAINSAVEIDLTGQVCADSVGSRIISGAGGQMDFMRGASLSEGGKSIIALTSRTRKGEPRIVASLRENSGVVTTRAEIHFVVTEYGVADLFGLTLHERAQALIAIAHPEDRERLQTRRIF